MSYPSNTMYKLSCWMQRDKREAHRQCFIKSYRVDGTLEWTTRKREAALFNEPTMQSFRQRFAQSRKVQIYPVVPGADAHT